MTVESPWGFRPGYPEADYHADEGLGSGSIKLLAKSPAAYYQSKKLPIEVNDAMDFGSAFHMRILEPERYKMCVHEMVSEISFATKEGKALKEEHAGKIMLRPKQVVAIHAMLDGLFRVKEQLGINPFEIEGHSEAAHFWGDGSQSEQSFCRGKALIDRQVTKLQWLVDVKTTRNSLDERSLTRYAADFGWAIQAAWYRRGVEETMGWKKPLFVFVVFQTVAPFSVRVMPVPEDTMDVANMLVERALKHHAELDETMRLCQFPRDPDSGTMELKYPDWFVENLNL